MRSMERCSCSTTRIEGILHYLPWDGTASLSNTPPRLQSIASASKERFWRNLLDSPEPGYRGRRHRARRKLPASRGGRRPGGLGGMIRFARCDPCEGARTMSGHSKWSTIKHKKAATDARRGKLFTKLLREITVAARMGGGDAKANPRLRIGGRSRRASNSVPGDNIERAIKKGTGELEGEAYEEVVYEGYGPGGVAVLVEGLTDNRNRTASEIRHLFTRHGGNLGDSGCVAWMFNRRGYFAIERGATGRGEAHGAGRSSSAPTTSRSRPTTTRSITADGGLHPRSRKSSNGAACRWRPRSWRWSRQTTMTLPAERVDAGAAPGGGPRGPRRRAEGVGSTSTSRREGDGCAHLAVRAARPCSAHPGPRSRQPPHRLRPAREARLGRSRWSRPAASPARAPSPLPARLAHLAASLGELLVRHPPDLAVARDALPRPQRTLAHRPRRSAGRSARGARRPRRRDDASTARPR